ncbi:MAG: slipin family protein [Candidatus Aenigmarchaeota archaeon]|nr:slipin family protein [Candidatus Aenigmarchaeota archaeon]
MAFESFFILAAIFVAAGIKILYEYERGVVFTLGRYTSTKEPGLKFIIPVIQNMKKIDMRVKAVDVPSQDAMTQDNVSARVNAVIYYKVVDSSKAIIAVEEYMYAMSQLAQTTMRNVIGEVSLDDLLSKREAVSKKILTIVDKESDPWGIKVINVELKDVTLPEEMKRVMAKQAEAEREKRAVIIKADGEVQASKNMATAAKTLASAPGALHLRTLQSINDLSSDQSNTIIFAVPLEVLKAFEGFKKKS